MALLHPEARLIDAATGASTGGSHLAERVENAAAHFARLPSGAAFLRTAQDVSSVVNYLGCWDAGRALALVDPDLDPVTLFSFIDRFEPAVVTGLSGGNETDVPPDGYRRVDDSALGSVWVRETPSRHAVHHDLAVLLATSGSTGNPKLVRLSRAAILANMAAIVDVLDITAGDVTISSLPFHYSFGMSVLNTHLSVGATIVIESGGLIQRPFWNAVLEHRVTSMSFVPYQFEILRRLRFDPSRYPSLKTIAQAGGSLRPERVLEVHQRLDVVGARLFVMYGQTEAAPRITTLPADQLPAKVGSVGPAIPGGALSVRLDDGTETTAAHARGEVLYRGPNVMMGYAGTAADLALGDTQRGLLETGDLGHLDEAGYLYIDGRIRRIGKVFGIRLNLDDVEAMLAGPHAVAAVNRDDRLVVWIEGGEQATLAAREVELAARLHLHRSGISVRAIDRLPLLPNGKVDLRALEAAE